MRLLAFTTVLMVSLFLVNPASAKSEDCVLTINPLRWVSCVFTPLEPEWEGEGEGDF
jgi:hypothetical protein